MFDKRCIQFNSIEAGHLVGGGRPFPPTAALSVPTRSRARLRLRKDDEEDAAPEDVEAALTAAALGEVVPPLHATDSPEFLLPEKPREGSRKRHGNQEGDRTGERKIGKPGTIN